MSEATIDTAEATIDTTDTDNATAGFYERSVAGTDDH